MLQSKMKSSLLQTILFLAFFISFAFVATLQVSADDSSSTNSSSVVQGVVYVKYQGKTTPCAINGSSSVDSILRRMGITLGELDTVEPSRATTVSAGSTVVVSTRSYETVKETGVIPFETIYYYSPDVIAGTEKVLVEGKDGYGTRVYQQLLVDGVVTEKTLISESLESTPVTKEIGTGFRSPLVSPLDHEWVFDANGEPINYSAVYRAQVTTAYSARVGAKTASGRDAIVGHVAVNPNVIPYGSKLFIQSADGSFIYGYAVAADTGTALLAGQVDIDLFFGTLEECIQFGRQDLDVFVLE